MKKILIIDDEQPILSHFRDLLGLLNYDSITASSSDEGIQLAEEENVDLIITDLCMPGERSEIEHVQKLRDVSPDTPIIVISGYPTPEVMEECEKIGITDFLTKPFELSFISEILGNIFPQEASGK